MAAMDQDKLNAMVASINTCATNYLSSVNTQVSSLLETFNASWVSPAAQTLATEISGCLSNLADSITNTFAAQNEAIAVSVNNFNATEDTNISYSGFSFEKPTTDLTLNATLPSGKVGVADGADLNTINTPVMTLVANINSTLDNISSTVSGADAFDAVEQGALTQAVNTIKTNFDTGMQELTTSLESRMSGEIEERDALNAANEANLSGGAGAN